MQTLTHAQYCHNKTIRASLGFMNGHYIYKGELYTPQEIEAKFPLDLPLISSMDRKTHDSNPDKSKNYLNNVKSY